MLPTYKKTVGICLGLGCSMYMAAEPKGVAKANSAERTGR